MLNSRKQQSNPELQTQDSGGTAKPVKPMPINKAAHGATFFV